MWLKRSTYRDSKIETFPGCYNTGHSPAVYHYYNEFLREPDKHEYYFVGSSGDLTGAYNGMRIAACSAAERGKRTYQGRFGKIWIYRTMQSARAKYEALCKEALAQRAKHNAERNALIERANQGDIKAALDLSDW